MFSFYKSKSAKNLAAWNSLFGVKDDLVFSVQDIGNMSCPHLPENECLAHQDPWLQINADEPVQEFSLRLSVRMEDGRKAPIYLYYRYANDKKGFSEEKSCLLPPSVTSGIVLRFSCPISSLRLDPGEEAGRLVFESAMIGPAREDWPVCTCEQRFSGLEYYKMLEVLEKRIKTEIVLPERVILLVTHEATFTGAPQLCRKIGDELLNHGFSVIYLALEQGAAVSLFSRSGGAFFYAPQNSAELAGCLERLTRMGVRKALLNTAISGICAEPLKKNGWRVIGLVHEMWASCMICNAQEGICSLARWADTVVFPAKCVEENFNKLCGGRKKANSVILRQSMYKETIPSTDDILRARRSIGAHDEIRVVLCAGAFNFGKGADLLPVVAQELARQRPQLAQNTIFVWLGLTENDPYAQWVKAMTRQMGLENRVLYRPYCENEREYMAMLSAADIFLLPSREDSMPSVLLEAISVKTPIIAFEKSGGAEELLSDGKGLLVPYMDMKQMAQAIDRLLTDPTFAAQTAQKAILGLHNEKSFAEYVDALLGMLADCKEAER